MKVQIDRQEDFILTANCLAQFRNNAKFCLGVVALTSSSLFVFNDQIPSEKVAELYKYHPEFEFNFSELEALVLSKISSKTELDGYYRLDFIMNKENNCKFIYFNKADLKSYKKIFSKIKKLNLPHKITFSKSKLNIFIK